ncbi:kinase-like domain-containing protein [Annulohypoxylon maeteangense]|uniref:kinase-like domain-containing protein n=1 Tax=Annulohypoxylon maeteangense TaxID=1927788 RepID=UPI002008DD00|nr:kinase-like domain-containing protein [Annulohypoxylon maeteangense]KAI0889308.1 kinase-like domain-containing protein [Annulohypoxylon maeteangense]
MGHGMMEPTKRLYRAGGDDALDLEGRERYRPGGYHPIHFNDYLDPENRFQVVHKLGWGNSSTVWLCYDEKCRYYKSVKVMTAEESVEECPELRILKALADVSDKELRENHLNIPRDHFWINGPNGRHLCLVSDLLGPSLFMNHPDGMGIHTPELLTDITFQVSKGLQYLHRKGICHGDLRPSNILMQLDTYDVMELTGRQISKYLGPRQYAPLETLSGNDPKPHGPDYLVFPVSLETLQRKCRTGRVVIVDFNDSFYHSDPPSFPKWNRQYAAPELLFTKTLSGPLQDIWALACTIYEIKTRTPLFSEYENYTSLIRQMELWFGPLPAGYRQSARTHLEREGKHQPASKDAKEHSDSTNLALEETLPNIDQLISLSPEEERNMRKTFIGKSEWLTPLQASLGRERDCSVYERNSGAYTSLDDTESDTDSSDYASQDWTSEDEGSQGDIYAQADLIFDGIEEESLAPDGFGGDVEGEPYSPLLQMTDASENQSGQVHDEESPAMPTTRTKDSEVPFEHGPGSSETESATSEMILRELLAKRDVDESSEDRDTKRRRTSEDSPKRRGEWVKRVVSMPKEEVLLLSDLLSRMFKHDPRERIDIDTIIDHDFWGDRRYNKLANPNSSIDGVLDPISTRTRSQKSRVEERSGQETEPSQEVGLSEPTEGEPTDVGKD